MLDLRSRAVLIFSLASFTIGLCYSASAQQADPSLYAGMRWRSIGPFRAGRVSAVAGIPGNAAVYYMASPGGGVWKTVDGGVVWKPIADSVPVASIGALVVAPSQPNVIYFGTGDVSLVGGARNVGNGVYKSVDAGRTWTHVGLDNTGHIGAMWIDPNNPDIVLVAALGHTWSQGPDRGVFKTTDGGKTWRKVLSKGGATGAVDLTFAPDNPRIGYATLWHHTGKPANPMQLIEDNSGAAIYKTTDEGETWTEIHIPGLTVDKLGRIGVATAMGGQRVFAIVAASGNKQSGLYRSDDGGATWKKSTTDPRVVGSGYFSRVFLDPNNPDVVYVAQTSLYRSTDGGHTFVSYKGAPGGDDNHALWIDPKNSRRMILASDQGATISQDTGKSWSSWYNQPTGQIYHMSTDNRFPYWVYGTQQDSGSVGTLSRGDYGEISFLDWDPVGGYEFGYIVPDPLHPEMVYAGGEARGLVRIDRSNRQVVNISPNVSRDGDYRLAMNPPLAFSPQNPHEFYEGTQFLLKTNDGGMHWTKISPDLTQRPGNAERNAKAKAEDVAEAEKPKKVKTKEAQETLTPPNRTAINTFSLSPVSAGEIWVGTNNGLVQLTRDGGKTWQQVSPPGLSQYSIVSMVEASHFDPAVAYVSVNRSQENDFKAHIYRTHDGGKTWQEADAGIPDGDFVRVVREDPARKGLLYAGTENSTWVSFDDGDHWSSLQLNMPTASVRDLQVRDGDLVAATYGRAFWILDDLSPLRQIQSTTSLQHVFLFRPRKALRVQRDLNQDTPLPPEMPAGKNPPDGAIIDYFLPSALSGDITLGIYDSAGHLVREYFSQPISPSTEPPPHVPNYWLARPQLLSTRVGMNRFVWDLRNTAPQAVRHEYPISAIYEDTPPEPQGALIVPGTYEVRLTVDGETYRQPLEVGMDPRVSITQEGLEKQFALEQKALHLVTVSYGFNHQAIILREAIAGIEKKLENQDPATLKALKDFDGRVAKIQGSGGGRPWMGGKPKPAFLLLNRELGSLAVLIDSADAVPTPSMETAYTDYCRDLATAANQWNALLRTNLVGLNSELAKQKLSGLPAAPIAIQFSCEQKP